MSNDAMPPTHRIAEVDYQAEAIECTCSAIVTARPDGLVHDRHQPLADAWAAHRREAGLVTPSVGRVMSYRRKVPA